MEKKTYIYENREFNILINRMPIWFEEFNILGKTEKGSIMLHTTNIYDEMWGPAAKIEISWELLEIESFYHPKIVQKNIDAYTAVDVALTKKKNDWNNSHNYTLWYGTRRKLIKTSYFEELSIHGIFYCDITQRVIELYAGVLKDNYEGFEPYILDSFKSVICH